MEFILVHRFMELDANTASKGPWGQCRMTSLPDYVRTLRIPGDFNWRKAVHTLLVHFKLPYLLPFADMMVKQQDEKDGPVDVMGPAGGSPFIFQILRDALSPLHLYALGALPAGQQC